MERRYLVAFATTHGSTQEIAERVTNRLLQSGISTEMIPARKVKSLASYNAVVLGAPMYMFRLHADARQFLSRHQKWLSSDIPAAVFAGGPYGDAKPEDWQEIRRTLDKELNHFPWFRPAAVEVVGGRHDPAHLRLPWSLIPAMRNMPPSDLRDWQAIDAWADSLPGVFSQSSLSQVQTAVPGLTQVA